jgi:anti-sigma factor RsiW
VKTEAPGRHLTLDEIVDRVFPAGEEPAPVPLHLAACDACQAKLAHLREGWLLDRGSVTGVVEAIPEAFWVSQAGATMDAVAAEPAALPRPLPFSVKRSILRRPILAFGSLAAALVLVTAISLRKPHAAPDQTARKAPAPSPAAVAAEELDRSDDELLLSIDQVLSEDAPFTALAGEGVS